MKHSKIFLLIIVVLLTLILVSCAPWGRQSAGGWVGTSKYEGTVYVGTLDGRVVAVNSSTGNIDWTYSILTTAQSGGLSCGETTLPTAIYGTPVVDEGIVYVGTYSGQVLALSMFARSQNLTFPQQRYGEWEWNCPIDNAKSNAIVADLLLGRDNIYVSSSNGRVYSLDKEFGDLNWESKVLDKEHRKLWTSPVIQGNILYISTYDGHVYALSVETGMSIVDVMPDWIVESEAGFASSPVIYEDTIFLGSFDRYLYAVNISSDEPMWQFPKEEPLSNWFWASPVVNDGIVYAGCLDGIIYAIEANTGEKIWEYDTGQAIISSPVLSDNLLIVVNESGTVYVFNMDEELGNNAEPWKIISLDAAVRSSFCAQEGQVYIRGDDGQLYMVDINTSGIRKTDLNIEE